MPTSFLDFTLPVYQSVKSKISNSFAISPTCLVSCRHIKLMLLQIKVLIIPLIYLYVPKFHVLKPILLLWTSFFTHTHVRKCKNPCLFSLYPSGRAVTLAHLSFFSNPIAHCSANDLALTLSHRWSMSLSFNKVLRWLLTVSHNSHLLFGLRTNYV